MKDVQCYELFGGIALKNHTFSFISDFFIMTSSVDKVRLSHAGILTKAVYYQHIIDDCWHRSLK